jgi:hypothetical protein
MCACTETDVRESANDCTLASREGHGSRGETFHPICAARPVYSSAERSVFFHCIWAEIVLFLFCAASILEQIQNLVNAFLSD